MTYMFQALEGIFTIMIVVGVGFILNKKGWFTDKSALLISKIVTTVSLPLYMITSITKNFTISQLIQLLPDMLLPMSSMILAMLLGILCAKLLKIRLGRRGIFVTNFFIANTMFIGLPVNLALFGDKSVPSVMLYYIVNLLFFWTLGVQQIVTDVQENGKGLLSCFVLKKLCSPALIGFIVAVLMMAFNIKLPRFIFNGFQYIANLMTPLSLIYIGIEISNIKLSEFEFNKDLIGGLFGRFIVCPLCVLVLIPFFAVSSMSAKVFTMQASMPAMTQMAIVAKQYGADGQYAAILSFVTILFSTIAIPLYMGIVNRLG